MNTASFNHRHGSSPAEKSDGSTRSAPVGSAWNQGRAPEDWWATIKHSHGHVGPWNVLGWRIGQAALRLFETEWGMHDLDIICYIPMATPYSCLADGLVIGTGNSIGRLDIRLAEVVSTDLIHVAVHRKNTEGPVLVFEPLGEYLRKIRRVPVEELERLSRETADADEAALFRIRQVGAASGEN